MGFIMEFAENLILRMMEDPRERDRKLREHLYDLKDKCPCVRMASGLSNATTPRFSGILRLPKSLDAETHMMTSSRSTVVLPPPNNWSGANRSVAGASSGSQLCILLCIVPKDSGKLLF